MPQTMNAKRWFPWVCLALMLIAEGMLFRSNHQRDQAVADLQAAQLHLQQAQAQLDGYTNSSAGQQAALIAFLKNQNDKLTTENAALKKNLTQLQTQNQQTAEHLTKARTALEMQQQNLQELQAAQQQAQVQADANACIANLHQLEVAKAQWALDKQKGATDVPTVQDLQPYLKDGTMPVCPGGGTYTLNAAGDPPTCSLPGHVLAQQ